MISILDYGAGNLRSVENTLSKIGANYRLVHTADDLRRATCIVLPGVGHFGQMMRAIDAMRVREALVERIRAEVPFLGICLGLQALFTESEEAPEERGLGIFEGTVRRFAGSMRIPHMGWNQLETRRASRLIAGQPYVYFAHSYYVPLCDQASAKCTYDTAYTAVLECGNIHGVQFHPEKSGAEGLAIVKRFVELDRE